MNLKKNCYFTLITNIEYLYLTPELVVTMNNFNVHYYLIASIHKILLSALSQVRIYRPPPQF